MPASRTALLLIIGWPRPQAWQRANGRNPDAIPHCSWNVIGNDNSAGWESVTENSCEDLNHVHCDDEGNIVERSLSRKGLRCDQMPEVPGFAKVTDFHAGYNQISGTIPQVLQDSVSLEEFVMVRHPLDRPSVVMCLTHCKC